MVPNPITGADAVGFDLGSLTVGSPIVTGRGKAPALAWGWKSGGVPKPTGANLPATVSVAFGVQPGTSCRCCSEYLL